MTSTDTPAQGRRRPAAPLRQHRSLRLRTGAALLAAVTLLVAGCGLRWEEPDPPPPVAGPVEQARQHATADAVALRVLTGQVAEQMTDPAALEVLARIERATDAHLTVLGGLYEPGTNDGAAPGSVDGTVSDPSPADGAGGTEPDAEPAPAATDDPPATSASPAAVPPAVTPPDLVALLEETASAARQDADEVPDGPLARLLASVATARLLLADELTGALRADPPTAPDDASDTASADTDATGPFVPPDAVPEGLKERDVQALVQSEDALGLAWEVAAARASDTARTQAALRAEQHRERAEQWARAGGISGTERDPRRSAYDLPVEITAADAEPAASVSALAALEADLAATYASLIATAVPGSRSALVDALVETSRTVVAVTGLAPAFPGLPERVSAPTEGPAVDPAA